MITEVRMPKLGMAMKKGAVTKWLKAEGDQVSEGADLFELASEKITAVVPAPASGVLGRVVADLGVELPVGALLALIGEPGDAFPPKQELAAAGAGPASAGPPAAAPTAAAPPAGEGLALREPAPAAASPAARRRARELGVDIAQVPPGAPGKRIMVEDVEAFAAAPQAAPAQAAGAPAGQVVPFAGIRKVVAERLTESLQTTAQVTIAREVEAGGLVARRAALAAGFEAATGVRLTYTDLLVQLVAELLAEHPLLNATLTEQASSSPRRSTWAWPWPWRTG
jgi:pyruvate dehydrogenase E2 component (dihydrolipoamide acetyltransferase)